SERAIVTPIAGTTRDVLRETVVIGGIALTLVDTAGLRESVDVVEREGVRRARAELARADVVVLVSEHAKEDQDRELLDAATTGAGRLIVHNKIVLHGEPARLERSGSETHVHVSARHGDGIDLLRGELARLAGREEGTAGTFSARTRHVLALQ